MTDSPNSHTEEWLAALLRCRAGDGFAATPGLPANTESTALALIALRSAGSHEEEADRARDWLLQRQRPEGGWTVTGGAKEGSWVTPWALLALHGESGVDPNVLRRGVTWVAHRKGRRPGAISRMLFNLLPAEDRTDLNPDLIGWPWHDGSFSWVEPTAVALLVLKRMRAELGADFPGERVEQGELLLYDRECNAGGWNYGNRVVLGEELDPYPDVTALALLALQDQPAERTAKARQTLQELLASEEASGLALALGAICLGAHGADASVLRGRLAERYRRTGFLGSSRTLAFASLAFTGEERFRVS